MWLLQIYGKHTDEVLQRIVSNDLLIVLNQSEYNDQIMSEISNYMIYWR